MNQVVCIKWGVKYSALYVNVLQNMLSRHLKIPHELICITDDPRGVNCKTLPIEEDLQGWWQKLTLFKENAYNIDKKFLYLDLDIVITKNIDKMFDRDGFWIIQDWHLPMFNSSVMLIEPNTQTQIWEKFDEDREKAIKQAPNGDQDWITQHAQDANTWPKPWCVSYRSHARFAAPPSCKIVVCHGEPKPVSLGHTWVGAYWQ